MTNRFQRETFTCKVESVKIPVSTNDTSELIRYVHIGLERIFEKGLKYKKAGIMLSELTSETQFQQCLFDKIDREKSALVMNALDAVNRKMGTNTLKYAAAGLGEKQAWRTVFNRRSPAYTTDWGQLPGVV